MANPRNPRPLVAGLLNALLFLSGPGYFYLDQPRKGWVALGVVVGLHVVTAASTFFGTFAPARVLWPVIWIFQLLTFLDAFLLARRIRGGEAVGPRDVAVPALGWMVKGG